MNIEQIAREVSAQMSKEAKAMEMHVMLAEFLRRCLSKLAEQAVEEPVAYMYPDKTGPLAGKCFVGGAQPGDIALYTEAQLIAAQQRTAEACARYCAQTLFPSKPIPNDAGRAWIAGTIHCADGIRNGEWREYL